MKPSKVPSFRAVPEEIKQEILAHLLSSDVLTYTDLLKVSKYIMSQLLVGNITDTQAEAARKYLELMLMTVTMDIQIHRHGEALETNSLQLETHKVLEAAEKSSKRIVKSLTVAGGKRG